MAPFQYKPRILSLLNTPLLAPVLPSSSLGCLLQPRELPSSPPPSSGSILNTTARVILSKYKLDQVPPLLNALQRPPSHWGKAGVLTMPWQGWGVGECITSGAHRPPPSGLAQVRAPGPLAALGHCKFTPPLVHPQAAQGLIALPGASPRHHKALHLASAGVHAHVTFSGVLGLPVYSIDPNSAFLH